MADYESRLLVPVVSDGVRREFYCKGGELLAIGYTRVVIGKRGPYVEFDSTQLYHDHFEEANADHSYFVELRSTLSNVMLYYQLKTVDYADYVPGMFYMSPWDLYVEGPRVRAIVDIT